MTFWAHYNILHRADEPEDGGSKFLRNFGNHLPDYTASVSRNSVVGIATGYGLDDQGVGIRVQVGLRIFSSPQIAQNDSGVHQTSYLTGTGGSFPGGVKWQEREADHSPPASVAIKKMSIYTSTPP
jgi:hypothetical protein